MRHGSLFSGIGGFDLASEWMGWENVFHCEWNEFGQKVLKHYWPKAITYNDITKTDFTIHRGSIDIITGGFPCQPYSMAGKRLGKEDERHLWPEMRRAIREIRPTWVVGENVFGLVNWNGGMVFEEVQADLEAEGYEVQAFVLPAASVNAPHKRERIWIVAHSKSCTDSGNSREVSREAKEEDREWTESSTSSKQQIQLPTEPSTLFGNVTNSNCSTERPSRESGGIKENWSRNNSQSEKWRIKAELDNRLYEFSQYASDSELKGLQRCSESREIRSEKGEMRGKRNKLATQFTSISNESNFAHSNNSRLKAFSIQKPELAEENRSTSPSGNSSRFICGGLRWETFPISAPICDGNDGISARLDGITFSKWRNESIKAGGNAIVPQVVHQIFKAIEQYNNLNK
jgi:DNA (cytosine-5)-methyltransferase 1